MLISENQFVEQLEKAFAEHKNGYISKREVDTGNGVPDLVLVRFLSSQVKLRLSYGQKKPIPFESFFELLNIIPDINQGADPVSPSGLRNGTGYSSSYVRSLLLPFLVENGYVVSRDGGLLKVNGWAPLSEHVIAIEAKLHDWKRGIAQAIRYKSFANEVYLATLPSTANNIDRDLLKKFKIGLLIFEPNSGDIRLRYSNPKKTVPNKPRLNFVNEQLLESYLQASHL